MDMITTKSHTQPFLNLILRKKSTKQEKTVTFAPTATIAPPPEEAAAPPPTATNPRPTSTTTMSVADTASQTSQDQSQPSIEPLHTPPSPFRPEDLTLLTQGAEALVYRTTYLTPTTCCALKYRPAKPWRHRILDQRLTRARILAEARVLVKCRRDGVNVPAVLGLDWEGGWLALEWVHGWTVRRVLDWWVKTQSRGIFEEAEAGEGEIVGEVRGLMERIGRAVGGLHAGGVVHGDLTTSNLMVRPDVFDSASLAPLEIESLHGQVVLIDFGLAQQSTAEEDKAVDLYVLERAFGSTHPEAEKAFGAVLEAYGDSYKGGKTVLRRLEDVRLRGRKKNMLG